MRNRTIALRRAGLLVLVATALTLVGCGGGGGGELEVEERIIPVSVATVEMSRVTPTLEFSGSIAPSREASVGAMMSAQVSLMHVEPGDRVNKGDLMVEMAGEQLTQVEAEFVSVQKDWERMTRLLEAGAVTQQAFDRIDAGYQAAKFILMPGDGASTPAIVEVIQMDEVKVEISVSERDLPEIRKGLKAELTVAAYPDRVFEGTVRLVEPVISSRTRTAKTEVVIPNPGELLRPGMFAHLVLELAPRDVLLVTHDGVLQQEGTGRYFSMLLENGHSRRTDVVLGSTFGAHHEVLSGLEAGQIVITAGRYRLPDGASVAARQEEGDR